MGANILSVFSQSGVLRVVGNRRIVAVRNENRAFDRASAIVAKHARDEWWRPSRRSALSRGADFNVSPFFVRTAAVDSARSFLFCQTGENTPCSRFRGVFLFPIQRGWHDATLPFGGDEEPCSQGW